MKSKDIFAIRRFMGAVEGVAIGLPEQAQALLFDYLEVVDGILDREDGAECREKQDHH